MSKVIVYSYFWSSFLLFSVLMCFLETVLRNTFNKKTEYMLRSRLNLLVMLHKRG